MQRWLKPFLIGIVVILTVLICFLLGATQKTHQPVQSPTISVSPTPNPVTKEELLRLVNIERAKAGVTQLLIDERLNQSAQLKADDEVIYDYFGHINHDGTHGYMLIGKTGLNCIYTSENLTENIHVNSSEAAFNAWVTSPAHHAAMIDPKYSLTGFGINGIQIVEHFCQTK